MNEDVSVRVALNPSNAIRTLEEMVNYILLSDNDNAPNLYSSGLVAGINIAITLFLGCKLDAEVIPSKKETIQ